jgi:hypothetical protein
MIGFSAVALFPRIIEWCCVFDCEIRICDLGVVSCQPRTPQFQRSTDMSPSVSVQKSMTILTHTTTHSRLYTFRDVLFLVYHCISSIFPDFLMSRSEVVKILIVSGSDGRLFRYKYAKNFCVLNLWSGI